MALRLCGSTPTVGSSSSRMSGSCSRPAARFSRRFMPPLKVFTRSRGAIGEADQFERRGESPRRAPASAGCRAIRRSAGWRAPTARRRARDPAARGRSRRFFGIGVAAERRAADQHLAAIGSEQSADHRDGRRLAGAVRSEQPDQLARRERERDVVDGDEVAERTCGDDGYRA